VRIRFRTRKLEKQYTNHQEANRVYGKEVARKFIQRVNIIKHAGDLEELKRMPGLRCHELKVSAVGLNPARGGRFKPSQFHSVFSLPSLP